MKSNNDILVDIPDEYLPKLAAFYEQEASWAPWMVGLVQTGIKWRKSSKFHAYVKFMSPNNCWEKDGTVIVTITYCNQDIFVFTTDKNCINLYEGLSQTKRLNYDDTRSTFFAVYDLHFATVKRVLKEKKVKIVHEIPNLMYKISPEEAKDFAIHCPFDIYVKKLQPEAAKLVNDAWPYGFPRSDQYIASYIETNGGYGLCLKSNNEMVAWIVKHTFGHLGMLHVVEEYRGKGHGTLLIKILSKEIAEEGRWPVVTTIINNKNSISIFEKLGFKLIVLAKNIAEKKR